VFPVLKGGTTEMNLDATAGNRVMWPCKTPPLTVFMDKETDLLVPPDVFAVWQHLPFRDGVFHTIIFDPPHTINYSSPVTWYKDQKSKGGRKGSWYGFFKTKRDLVLSLCRAAAEFYRVGEVLCVKWYEGQVSLHKIIPLFRPWRKFKVFKPKPRMGRRSWRKSSPLTWWVTFNKEAISR